MDDLDETSELPPAFAARITAQVGGLRSQWTESSQPPGLGQQRLGPPLPIHASHLPPPANQGHGQRAPQQSQPTQTSQFLTLVNQGYDQRALYVSSQPTQASQFPTPVNQGHGQRAPQQAQPTQTSQLPPRADQDGQGIPQQSQPTHISQLFRRWNQGHGQGIIQQPQPTRTSQLPALANQGYGQGIIQQPQPIQNAGYRSSSWRIAEKRAFCQCAGVSHPGGDIGGPMTDDCFPNRCPRTRSPISSNDGLCDHCAFIADRNPGAYGCSCRRPAHGVPLWAPTSLYLMDIRRRLVACHGPHVMLEGASKL